MYELVQEPGLCYMVTTMTEHHDTSSTLPQKSPLPTREEAERLLEEARLMAAVNLHVGMKLLGERLVVDDAMTLRGQLDLMDHFLKVSGLMQKQEQKSGNSVTITINIPQLSGSSQVLTIEHNADSDLETLGTPPLFALSSEGNLMTLASTDTD